MKSLATIALLLVITLVSISAYLRLDHSGIGCAHWPSCYGQIGAADEQQPTATTTYERLIKEAAQPLSWATPVHRLVASVLGLLILGMALLSLRLRRDRSLSFALVVAEAGVGIAAIMTDLPIALAVAHNWLAAILLLGLLRLLALCINRQQLLTDG
jgi:cytochrome c oxidase assembly protein subunit 15